MAKRLSPNCEASTPFFVYVQSRPDIIISYFSISESKLVFSKYILNFHFLNRTYKYFCFYLCRMCDDAVQFLLHFVPSDFQFGKIIVTSTKFLGHSSVSFIVLITYVSFEAIFCQPFDDFPTYIITLCIILTPRFHHRFLHSTGHYVRTFFVLLVLCIVTQLLQYNFLHSNKNLTIFYIIKTKYLYFYKIKFFIYFFVCTLYVLE